MLRPWVPLIAFAMLWALGRLWFGNEFLVGLGGCLLAAAVLSQLWQGLGPGWDAVRAGFRRKRAVQRASRLDWTVIDNSMQRERLQRDCERPETLGVCTGLECLVYKTCNFNIKKPLP